MRLISPPVKHFHIVFTIPACLHKLFYINQRIAYSLLFKAAGQTLMQCARNTHYLGAEAGAVALLHTWGQTMTYHPHIHTIVPAGGVSDDGMEWVPSAKSFFCPGKSAQHRFQGVFYVGYCRSQYSGRRSNFQMIHPIFRP